MARPDSKDREPQLISSVEHVYRQTRTAILRGDYAPGSQLKLLELAKKNDVSLIPVREALRMLEMEGFVESVRNRGARVAPLSKTDMLDAYQSRLILEAEALRLAYARMTPESIAGLRDILDRAIGRLKRNDEEGFVRYHRQLHFGLYEGSGSKWLMRFIDTLWAHVERYQRLSAYQVTGEEIRAQHVHILDALERHDVDGAVEALQRHLHGTLNVVIPLFEARHQANAAQAARRTDRRVN
jgi:DNA-binding GntR family transcriptional regulator